jgi:hypothetical protein
MSRSSTIEQTARRVVALRRIALAVSDPRESRRLDRMLRELRRELGFSVPKTRAAAVLGVSVNALDRWIEAGRLPTVRRPGSAREEIDADALVDLALEVERLREEGVARGVLAAAFARLAAEGKPRRRPRPNTPAHRLRADFLGTTPAERLATGAELSYAGSILAAYGRAQRRRAAE